MNRVSILVAVGVAAALTAVVGAPLATATHVAGAETFRTNPYFNCRGDHGIGVPNGHRLVLRMGWGAKNRGLVQDFLNAIDDLRVVVAGVEIDDPSQYWSEPAPRGDIWVTFWTYDTGKVVTFGNPFWIEITSTASHRLHDGIVREEGSSRPVFFEAGDRLLDTDGPCLVGAF